MKAGILKIMAFSFVLFLFESCSKSEVVSQSQNTNSDNFQPVATEDIVMYEINLNAFSATKNIQGIINRLDNLKALGVNTIWLMPIYPVGAVNSFGSPYCVREYTSVNPMFGNLQDLQNLVRLAHAKNIAVILDWVANHTSWDNTWITLHPEWYTHNAGGQIISPEGTNWNDVADLNYSNAPMRLAMIDAMKYWVINANIDGFRCDAADYVPYDFWFQATTALNAIPNKQLILLAEGNRADHFAVGFQMNYAWDFLTAIKNVVGASQTSVATLFTSNTTEFAAVPSGKQKLRFTTNHDESNIASPISVYGSKNGAIAASVVTIFMQGVPLLYCGQEVGVSATATYNGSNTIDWNANPDMLATYQKLLGFYNTSSTVRKGTLTSYSNTNVAIFKKTTTSEQVVVLVNCRATTQNVTLDSTLQGDWKDVFTNATVSLAGNVSLTGYQYLILKK